MIIKILLVALATFGVLRWLRADASGNWSIFDCLPFCDGTTERAPCFDVAALILLAFVVARLSAFRGAKPEDTSPGWEWEDVDEEDGEDWDEQEDDEDDDDE